jgi:hypothetical protein
VQLLVAICTLLGMLYAFKTFLSKPKDSMIKRIINTIDANANAPEIASKTICNVVIFLFLLKIKISS